MGLIVFLGDSITDAGRFVSDNPLGNGYVNAFAESLPTRGLDWQIINNGVEGYIAQKISEELHKNCIPLHPDYVSILVGINDVGVIASSDASEQEKLYMLEDSIRAFHEMLFDLSRETDANVIILEPFLFPKNGTYEDWVPWRRKMAKNIRKLARNYHAEFIPLQEPLEQQIARYGYDEITTDGIHLTQTGQIVLAEIIKNAFEL